MHTAVKFAVALSAVVAALSASAQSYDRHERYSHDRIDASQIDTRQARQRERIERGFERGDLTRREYRMLRREQRDIALAEQQAKADGRLNRRELRELMAMLDRADAHIRQQRHDRDDRVAFR